MTVAEWGASTAAAWAYVMADLTDATRVGKWAVVRAATTVSDLAAIAAD